MAFCAIQGIDFLEIFLRCSRRGGDVPVDVYKRQAYGKPVPRITPHVLRHTFCTNVQQAGLDVKSLQYLMGHSNASVTLDVYTHSSFESVERAFEQIAGNL